MLNFVVLNYKISKNMTLLKILEIKIPDRGFGEGLFEAAKKNENIVALCADLTGSVKMDKFAANFNSLSDGNCRSKYDGRSSRINYWGKYLLREPLPNLPPDAFTTKSVKA